MRGRVETTSMSSGSPPYACGASDDSPNSFPPANGTILEEPSSFYKRPIGQVSTAGDSNYDSYL